MVGEEAKVFVVDPGLFLEALARLPSPLSVRRCVVMIASTLFENGEVVIFTSPDSASEEAVIKYTTPPDVGTMKTTLVIESTTPPDLGTMETTHLQFQSDFHLYLELCS